MVTYLAWKTDKYRMFKKYTSFSNLTLLVALSLSSVAAYYSIIGLTAIFAGAVIPVIIMGSILEVGKITTTVWLRKYWNRAGWVLKLYLVPAVVALALLTSMGIFGFLSKAHMETGVTSGDAQGKVAIYDEKIKTAKDNIDANRKALKQLDEAVDQVMGRSTSEQGADKAVQIRRSQANDRKRLLAEIQAEQTTVSKLSEERAPLASELRKVEAEVGPIKYIAALIYGDNADANMLEAAVRWVIILLVVVFDPLAIALVLAANASKEWDKEEPEEENKPDAWVADVGEKPTKEELEEIEKVEDFFARGKLIARGLDADEEARLVAEANEKLAEIEKEVPEVIIPQEPMKFVDPGEHPADYDETAIEEPVIVEEDPSIECLKCNTVLVDVPGIGMYCPNVDCGVEIELEEANTDVAPVESVPEIITENVTTEVQETKPFEEHGDYVLYEGKHMHREALKSMKPELFRLTADSTTSIKSSFGTDFPKIANKGDIRVRVDVLPNRVYKFDGNKWIEINKEQSDTYLYDHEYIKFLIERIELGEYDIDLLSDAEKQQVEDYLSNQKS